MKLHHHARLAIPSLLLALFTASAAFAAEDYKIDPDSLPQEGAPRGEVTQQQWESKIFPGTVRDYWVYVPKRYDAAKPACVMVFQDGASYVKTNGDFRT